MKLPIRLTLVASLCLLAHAQSDEDGDTTECLEKTTANVGMSDHNSQYLIETFPADSMDDCARECCARIHGRLWSIYFFIHYITHDPYSVQNWTKNMITFPGVKCNKQTCLHLAWRFNVSINFKSWTRFLFFFCIHQTPVLVKMNLANGTKSRTISITKYVDLAFNQIDEILKTTWISSSNKWLLFRTRKHPLPHYGIRRELTPYMYLWIKHLK